MTKPTLEELWSKVPQHERKTIEAALGAVEERFRTAKSRDLSDCYDSCAQMEQAMMEVCQQMAGTEAASAACAAHAAHAGSACVKGCLQSHGQPSD